MNGTRTMMWLAGAAGFALLAALIHAEGWAGIAAAVGRAGWALLLIVPARVVTQALDTRAWRLLLDPFDPARAAGPPSVVATTRIRPRSASTSTPMPGYSPAAARSSSRMSSSLRYWQCASSAASMPASAPSNSFLSSAWST